MCECVDILATHLRCHVLCSQDQFHQDIKNLLTTNERILIKKHVHNTFQARKQETVMNVQHDRDQCSTLSASLTFSLSHADHAAA